MGDGGWEMGRGNNRKIGKLGVALYPEIVIPCVVLMLIRMGSKPRTLLSVAIQTLP